AADQVQQRRLAATRRAHERHEVALRDLEREPAQHFHFLSIPAIRLVHVTHFDGSHGDLSGFDDADLRAVLEPRGGVEYHALATGESAANFHTIAALRAGLD